MPCLAPFRARRLRFSAQQIKISAPEFAIELPDATRIIFDALDRYTRFKWLSCVQFFTPSGSKMNSKDLEIILHGADVTDEMTSLKTVECFASGKLDIGAMAAKFRDMLKRIAAQELPESLRFRLDDSDVVQETLVRALRSSDDFRGTTDLELQQWLREILKSQLIDSVRFHNRQQRDIARDIRDSTPELADGGQTPSEAYWQRESSERLWLAVAELPEDYRTVILLRQQMDLSFPEIGERMGKTADAVRMLWGRAILMLGQRLRQAASRWSE